MGRCALTPFSIFARHRAPSSRDGFGGGSTPSYISPPAAPPAAQPATLASSAVASNAASRQAATAGALGVVGTPGGEMGLAAPQTAKQTLGGVS